MAGRDPVSRTGVETEMNAHCSIASASWPDHLVFGEGDGKMDTVDAVQRRMQCWCDQPGARTVHWREVRTRTQEARWYAAPGNPMTQPRKIRSIQCDDLEVVPQLAHELHLKAHPYVSVLDEGRPLLSQEQRAVLYHKVVHGQDITWQNNWSRLYPQYTVIDRKGADGIHGFLSEGR